MTAPRSRKVLIAALVLAGVAFAAIQWGNDALGALDGKRLPTSGANFVAYSRLGALLGRNSVSEAD